MIDRGRASRSKAIFYSERCSTGKPTKSSPPQVPSLTTLRRGRTFREAISVIHNPVELASADSDDEPPHRWFGTDEPVIVAAGRYTPEKDFRTLLRAFHEVRKTVGGRLIVLGDGKLRDELEAQVRTCLSRNGFLCTDSSTIRTLHGGCRSVRPLVSIRGFGNVLVEAMSCGTPVVATNCGSGPVTILEDGRYGPLVPVGDASRMADAMLETVSDPPAPELLRERAQDFSVETIVSQYLELIETERVQQRVRRESS
ncbi:glycosyltransferase [Natrialba swarupiae]|nr:glycosyltransferase [Natrialba swarupiae]